MPRRICYISDFFIEHILGGAEINDNVLLTEVFKTKAERIQSHLVSLQRLKENTGSLFIISNFTNITEPCKEFLQRSCSYIIYEHDHKYLRSRDPSLFEAFKAPEEEIINLEFYKNAKKVICQSQFHLDILQKNLNINNVINISGNLWSLESLELMRKLGKKEKKQECSIVDSNISHKNMLGAIAYCKAKNKNYNLVKSSEYFSFLDQLSNSSTLVFFPTTPETLSRVTVEARMLGMKTITNKNIGAIHEEWFSLKGEKLIDYMVQKKEQISNMMAKIANE